MNFFVCLLGNAVGTAVTFPLCGLLIDMLGSWEWAFYIPALLCLTWCFFWFYLAYDSPAQHPRISPKEQAYLERTVTPHLSKVKVRELKAMSSA
jgi:ACS family sodium-dependent inorganic phosphate cotransporter-like MFS transporter 5